MRDLSKKLPIKIVIAFLVAFILIVSFHKGVAADLSELPPLAGSEKDKDISEADCETFPARAQEFLLRLELVQKQVLEYLTLASGQYAVWHKKLASSEGKRSEWLRGHFDPLTKSAENLTSAKSLLYSLSYRDEEIAAQIESTIDMCVQESPLRAQVLAELQNFSYMNSQQHLVAVAEFFGPMAARLTKSVGEWRQLEGSSEFISQGHFAGLEKDSGIWIESAVLVDQNFEMVKAQYRVFLNDLSRLILPLAQR